MVDYLIVHELLFNVQAAQTCNVLQQKTSGVFILIYFFLPYG